MSPRDLTSLLRPADGGRRDRTPECPDEHWIAAYVDGLLPETDREQLELHLADCDACLALVGLLSRDRDTGELAPVPETTVARARSLATPVRRRWTRQAPRWAAAAAVLLAVPVLLHLGLQPGGGGERPGEPAERVTRSLAPGTSTLEVLFPSPGMTVEPQQLSVRWKAIPGSDYYDVRVVTESGDLVVEQRVTGTEWRPTGPLDLRPGVEYFVQVDAYPAEGKALRSDHVPFRIRD